MPRPTAIWFVLPGATAADTNEPITLHRSPVRPHLVPEGTASAVSWLPG